MQKFQKHDISDFKQRALQWASLFDTACYFDSNQYTDRYSSFDVLIAAGSKYQVQANAGNAFTQLNDFLAEHDGYKLGYFGYDLKNEIEHLSSENPDNLDFPDLYFFVPQHLILLKGTEVYIDSEEPELLFNEINGQQKEISTDETKSFKTRSRFSEATYLKTVEHLKQHILRGDIYEVNLCQEFYAEGASINPLAMFRQLNAASPTPFANFFRLRDKYIISATPERYLRKRGNKLISQPIKGTAPRGQDPETDALNREMLRKDQKEQAENVMIVDLVRNDLTRCAAPGSVAVEELFGVYSFKQVHQMISTVVCEADPKLANADIIRNTFPMGSMTGAPKVRAMEFIEQYERAKRGVYSGAVGYFSPGGDFDFNVIIRTILYNATRKYLSFQVGSAITYEADPSREYQECLLKASAIKTILK
ncbi:MAG TPA: anthranilate synthase component I family protein [Sphingobacteriaceae bacterium]